MKRLQVPDLEEARYKAYVAQGKPEADTTSQSYSKGGSNSATDRVSDENGKEMPHKRQKTEVGPAEEGKIEAPARLGRLQNALNLHKIITGARETKSRLSELTGSRESTPERVSEGISEPNILSHNRSIIEPTILSGIGVTSSPGSVSESAGSSLADSLNLVSSQQDLTNLIYLRSNKERSKKIDSSPPKRVEDTIDYNTERKRPGSPTKLRISGPEGSKNSQFPLREYTNGRFHTKIHNPSRDTIDAKPFACSFPGCKWAFTRNSDLRRHTKSHLKPEFRCPYWRKDQSCHRNGGAFNRLDVLKRHLRLVHYVQDKEHVIPDSKEDPGWCRTCQRSFSHSKAFIQHCQSCAELQDSGSSRETDELSESFPLEDNNDSSHGDPSYKNSSDHDACDLNGQSKTDISRMSQIDSNNTDSLRSPPPNTASSANIADTY
ncbi:Piso0_004669 [Millerozyma farinosa CBS 7064]|uniref:Piso0_004669 protein n=1 Tax=Pichia sorbitophila (strain ATCC MYA-4447 / BCRC 22081 / CBS 7064 / NBRC 10061 / NRRL Y-12695) TaxID=559304 RepID=G8Y9F2_PICSO|nr:Piso0_004669 [Millerozyma farinosa CBS 7064]CCE85097.1 Piso0_004669 [Millerozyma farinosa CBS 7064]